MSNNSTRPKIFDEFSIGDNYEFEPVRLTDELIRTFAKISGDFDPLHLDEEHGEKSIFKSRIAHGHLVASIASGSWSKLVTGTVVALLESSYRYLKPVRVGDEIRVKATVIEKKASSKYSGGVIRLKITVVNQDNEPVVEGGVTVLVANDRASKETLASAEATANAKTESDLYELWMKTYQETFRLLNVPLTAQSLQVQNQFAEAADYYWQLSMLLARIPLQLCRLPD